MAVSREKIDPSDLELKDTVVSISRVTKVVKGGKNLSFSALVVVGDGPGVVGFGIGKAKEVPSAIKKAIESAKKALVRVPMSGSNSGKNSELKTRAAIVAYRKKSYHSITDPKTLARTVLRCCLCWAWVGGGVMVLL